MSGRRTEASTAIDRMLLAPAAHGRMARRVSNGSVAVFGTRDSELAEDLDRGDYLALSGYVRRGGRATSAAELLAAWRKEGDGVLDKLSGEFAVAARIGERVVVSRDALGTRPLYVANLPGVGVAFSTSLFALLYAGASPEVDRDAAVRSLVLGFPTAPGTAVASVRQLAPGELWELGPRTTTHRWFAPSERLHATRTLDAAARAVDKALTVAVESALPARDGGARPVGAFLSGGLDSAVVLARVHESGTPVVAFTLSFGDHLPGEMRYARAVARHLGVKHDVLSLDARRFCDGIPSAVEHLEDVVSETIAVPNFLLARQASQSVDVLFTGEGGDQSFGGPKNVGMALAYAYGGHRATPSLAHTYLSLYGYCWDDLADALQPDTLAAFDSDRMERDVGRRFFGERVPRDGSFVGRVMIGNTVIKGGHYILVKVAKMIAFAHDLSLRSPLYNRALVELAFTIPPGQKLDGTDEKLVLRRAALRSLPQWVVDRPKRGMMLPLGYWFARELGGFARDVLTESAVRDRGLLRWKYVERLLAQAPSSRAPARLRSLDKLWLVLMTELHHRAIDKVARTARDLARAGNASVAAHA